MLTSTRITTRVNLTNQAVLKRSFTSRNTPRPRPKLDFFTPQPLYRSPFFPNQIFRRSFANGYRNIDSTFATAQAATRIIIGLNTAVFGAWTYGKVQQDRKLLGWLSENFTLSAANWRAGRYYTMLTSAFSHQDPVHFLFNMIAFNAFGGILMVSGLGGMHVASLCIGSAIAGSFAWLYQRGIANRSQFPNLPNAVGVSGGMGAAALGASGMVMGAGMAATCLMPMAPAGVLFIPVAVPLWVLTSIYFGLDAYYLNNASSRIGHSAHLGGAIYGAMYYFGYLRNYGGVWIMLRRLLRR